MTNFEFNEMYGKKIISLDDLTAVLPWENRKKKVILCHGVFDLVHPGHVRHLVYAKSKADVLVVSITADGHINKGQYRPHIPQQIRALNLAAFEMVDFVLIDDKPTPLDLIGKLKPDFLAKGFEYGEMSNSNTVLEQETLFKYGGKIIFTPGDVVYSSSSIINSEKETFGRQNLGLILESEKIEIGEIIKTIDSKKMPRVLVIGDSIVDTILECTSIGGQIKTPTLSVKLDKTTDYVGGAGIVAAHLRGTGANVDFLSVIGDDQGGKFLSSELRKFGVNCHLLVDDTRPTTVKKVYVSNSHRLLKVDTVDNRPISSEIFERIIESMSKLEYDIAVLCDFRHGIFTKEKIPKLVKSIPLDKFKVADSQVASRWGNILDFKNFDLITPNEREGRFSLGDQESTVVNLTLELCEKSSAKNIILKLGSRGSMSASQHSTHSKGIFSLPSLTNSAVDPVGAGDALLAYATLTLFLTGDVNSANLVGATAASLACEVEGNVPISSFTVFERLKSFI